MLGPKPLDIFGPWAQDGPSHLAASSARCRKCWFTSLRRMVSQRPSEPPTNSTVNCSVPSGNFLGLTGQGTPRNSKESQGTLASEENDKTSGWLGGFWMGFLGFSYWYVQNCTKCLGFDGTLQGIIQIEHWIESRVNFGVWSGRFLCLFPSFIERSQGSTTSPRAGIIGLSKRLGGIN